MVAHEPACINTTWCFASVKQILGSALLRLVCCVEKRHVAVYVDELMHNHA